ncbi:LacI family DNA-binding transcriptional regulator [Streptomyces sp. NPDC087532]|uniref:LacI family DNA-binding transcriptional regulator n=1 Tax=unclassified Streptomyces TaxID=2593676 RepID=UPI00344A3603
MGYAENRGTYYRGRYKLEDGTYGTVKDSQGRTIRFQKKRDAKQAADAAEVEVRAGTHVDPTAIPTFAEYVNKQWWPAQDLAASTMQNYPSHIQGHLLPYFGASLITSITRTDVEAWEKSQRTLYAASSVTTYRSVLHLILQDAVEDVPAMLVNPAARRRGRGKRAGRSKNRGPEKVVTTPMGALLVAERAAILSGRDDEFIETISTAYTGMRWGETVGLDRDHVKKQSIQIEWQLYELNDGTFVKCPPKDDSYREIDTPEFLSALLSEQKRRQVATCPCHRLQTIFRAASLRQELRVPRARIAELAGVSPATVSRVRNRPDTVTQLTAERVLAAMAQLGVIEQAGAEDLVPHWGRDDHRSQVIEPASSGWYPKRGSADPARPVCVVAGEHWPGTVIRGRWSATQADACWAPVAPGLTNHGLRHCHSTWLEDLGTPSVLIDERMGHIDGSVSARYKHVTDGMRDRMLAGLTGLWVESLTARAALSPSSPVGVLNRLLQEHAGHLLSQNSPQRVISQAIRSMDSAPDLHVSKWVA